MRGLNGRALRLIEAIDTANADDPTTVEFDGATHPLALIHGQRASWWVDQLHADAPDEWRIAARAHHLRRWELPRRNYPDGKAGYHRWKRDQRTRHAADVAALMAAVGYDDGAIVAVQALIRREQLSSNTGAQAVEDAACLVFVETQLTDIAAKFERGQVVDILRKTARKMSSAAIDAMSAITRDTALADLVDEAMTS